MNAKELKELLTEAMEADLTTKEGQIASARIQCAIADDMKERNIGMSIINEFHEHYVGLIRIQSCRKLDKTLPTLNKICL